MKKKKIYVNKITSKIGNNQELCKVEEKNNVKIDNISVQDKLNRLLNTNGYIFNKKVKIITNSKTYETNIASLIGNNIVTLDNNIININDVKDIVY